MPSFRLAPFLFRKRYYSAKLKPATAPLDAAYNRPGTVGGRRWRNYCGIEQLRQPLKATVGMLEVEKKRKHLLTMNQKDLKAFLKDARIPTVIGKYERHYVVDHHHLARALWDGGITKALATVVEDLSRLPESKFWNAAHWNSANGSGVFT
ncbi:ParB-like protein [Paraburkholderia strydomiana]|uniref:ParB-like protein n=1 Tax=Paraburkholderia strydomiana TaxID=1245417 RepID=UPI0038BAA052